MSESSPTSCLAKKVLLIGWDAADWKMINPLVEQGLMPAMKKFTEHGVMGNIASLNPMLSPMLWTSIATGKTADKHDILGFCEPDGTTGKVRPVTSTSRKCKAIWNILSERGIRSGAINWFASQPAEHINGFVVTDRFPHAMNQPDEPWPTISHSVHPDSLLEELAELRVHPADTTADQVAAFIPFISEVDPTRNQHIAMIRGLLAQCATIHSAATHLLQNEEWEFCAVYYDTIDRFAHAFMEFHPPKMEHVSDEDFRLYKDVMVSCYRFHDMMLSRLMEIAGDDCIVMILSDHGFQCDHLRPRGTSNIKDGQPVAWHRPYGAFAVHGPNIKQDERIYGASLLDITPTILNMFGLPVAKDMDGQSLTQMFIDSDSSDESNIHSFPEPIATYENDDTEEDDSRVLTSDEEDPWVAQQILQQLKDLGYVDEDDTESIVLDRKRNLAQVHMAAGRADEVIAICQDILADKPNDNGAKILLAQVKLAAGELDACEQIVKEILKDKPDGPEANLHMGMIEFRRGHAEKALDYLSRAEEQHPNMSGLQEQVGQVYLYRKMWDDAERVFRKAIEVDTDSAPAYDGLGIALRQLGKREQAANAHMHSIALLHYRPQTHVNLGLVLAELGRMEWAIRAFNVAIDMAPDHPMPHRCLAEIYERAKNDPEQAKFHRDRAKTIMAARDAK